MDRVYRAEKSLCSLRKLKPYITTGHRRPRDSLKSHLWRVAPINSKAGIPRTDQFFVSLTKETMPPLPWLTCATSFVGGFQRACQPMEAVPIFFHIYPTQGLPDQERFTTSSMTGLSRNGQSLGSQTGKSVSLFSTDGLPRTGLPGWGS